MVWDALSVDSPRSRRNEGEIEMEPLPKIEREHAVIIIIDVQEALMKSMDQEVGKRVIQNIKTLISLAKTMSIPILMTEQYPKGLGKTLPEINADLESLLPIEKLSFSCCGVAAFNHQLDQMGRKQIILTGVETHVCVLQTADDLIRKGYEVYPLADATCSRRKLDWKIGLRWMEKGGAMISTTEIIAFQLMKEAGTEEFRGLSKLFKKT